MGMGVGGAGWKETTEGKLRATPALALPLRMTAELMSVLMLISKLNAELIRFRHRLFMKELGKNEIGQVPGM